MYAAKRAWSFVSVAGRCCDDVDAIAIGSSRRSVSQGEDIEPGAGVRRAQFSRGNQNLAIGGDAIDRPVGSYVTAVVVRGEGRPGMIYPIGQKWLHWSERDTRLHVSVLVAPWDERAWNPSGVRAIVVRFDDRLRRPGSAAEGMERH